MSEGEMTNYVSSKVFISYAWGREGECIAQEVEKALTEKGLALKLME